VGPRSLSMVTDQGEHGRQRALMMPFFSPDAVAAKMPAIQDTVGLGGRGGQRCSCGNVGAQRCACAFRHFIHLHPGP
jgi:hypothetical protein